MFLKFFNKIFKALNSNVKKEYVAAGIASGLLLALIPVANLLWICLFLILFLFKQHYGMQLVTMGIIKLLYPFIAPLIDALGWYVLHIEKLQKYFIQWADLPIAPLTRFNNTLVMGGLVAGIILWLPVFFLFRILVSLYRSKLSPTIRQSKLYSSFVKLPGIAKIVSTISSFNFKGGK